jgi:hypothetical protein
MPMTFTGNGTPLQKLEALRTLAEYLELSLEMGGCPVMMRPRFRRYVMCVGNPAGLEDDLQRYGTIEKVLAEEILQCTHAGINCLEIDGQPYRFIRSFANVARHGVVVFAPT